MSPAVFNRGEYCRAGACPPPPCVRSSADNRSIVDEYSKYVQSFLSIADERVRRFVEEHVLSGSALWPDALLQLNPTYMMASTVEQLAQRGTLHPACADIFRTDNGQSIRLYRHQEDAIERPRESGVSGVGGGEPRTASRTPRSSGTRSAAPSCAPSWMPTTPGSMASPTTSCATSSTHRTSTARTSPARPSAC